MVTGVFGVMHGKETHSHLELFTVQCAIGEIILAVYHNGKSTTAESVFWSFARREKTEVLHLVDAQPPKFTEFWSGW